MTKKQDWILTAITLLALLVVVGLEVRHQIITFYS